MTEKKKIKANPVQWEIWVYAPPLLLLCGGHWQQPLSEKLKRSLSLQACPRVSPNSTRSPTAFFWFEKSPPPFSGICSTHHGFPLRRACCKSSKQDSRVGIAMSDQRHFVGTLIHSPLPTSTVSHRTVSDKKNIGTH